MGTVWRARDELLHRDVAVKEIIWPPYMSPLERETARRRAVREAQMAARLRHPNIVGVYDIVEEDGRPSIVMEFVPFRSLRDTVREDGPLSPADAAQVGLGILEGLKAAHDANIVHRDVKPANILLGPEGRVVLTDFGIAKAADSAALTTSGVLVGSPSYIAPERARGGDAGAPADLWGLGASLYAAVEGHPPFERDSALAILTAVVADEPDPPLHAGPLAPVISGLLDKDPATRLTAADTEPMLRRVIEEADAAPVGPPPEAAVAPGAARPEDAPIVAGAAAEPVTHGAVPEPATHGAGPELAVSAAPSEPETSGAGPEPPAPGAAPEPVPPGPARPRRFRGSRRTSLAALVAVLAVAVLAAGIALLSARSPGHQTPRAASTPAPSARSAPTATAKPSRPAPSTSAPSTSVPSSSPTAAQGGSGSQAGGVPAGYYRFTNSTGFSIGVPAGWQISHVGHYVYIRDPANSGIFLLIDQSDQPRADPLADWRQQAAARASSYPGYHLIELQTVSYPQAEKAADWEFTYYRSGVQVQVLNRNVLANAHHAYALYWSTPVSDWDSYYHYFQTFAATFRPAT
jgi:tRNA A-37 threonylcarbamoyl transferase component Bud32